MERVILVDQITQDGHVGVQYCCFSFLYNFDVFLQEVVKPLRISFFCGADFVNNLSGTGGNAGTRVDAANGSL